MIGHIIKIHSDFYYADSEVGIIEAKLKDTLKKSKTRVLVGDFVELSGVDISSHQAFISSVVNRKNYISRPRAANITRALIVSALQEPALDFVQIDRFIALCEYHNIKPVLCFNKDDLGDFTAEKNKIKSVYENTGYSLLFTSALERTGIEALLSVLKDNTTLLCGVSGVGKSSILNSLFDELSLRTKPVSGKTGKGTHTTRHCELLKIDDNSFVIDSPGFSNIVFDFLLPIEIQKLFIEFEDLNLSCKYSDCLHLDEHSCGLNKESNNIPPTRYESYKTFVNEAKKYKEKILTCQTKKEDKVKYNFSKNIVKISARKRLKSRKYNNQNIKYEINEEV